MRKFAYIKFVLATLVMSFSFVGCGGGTSEPAPAHDEHEGHDHDGHDHSEHEGHDHE